MSSSPSYATYPTPSLPITTKQCEIIANNWVKNIKENILKPYLKSPDWTVDYFDTLNKPHTAMNSTTPSHFTKQTGAPDPLGLVYFCGKWFHIVFFNKKENMVVSFAYFLTTAQGPRDGAHGGLIFTLLDNLFGMLSSYQDGTLAFTANLSVDFKERCPLLQTVKCIGKIDHFDPLIIGKSQKIKMSGRIETLDGETIIATGNSLWIAPQMKVENGIKIREIAPNKNIGNDRATNLLPYKAEDGSYYCILPNCKSERQKWIENEIQEEINELLSDPDVYQHSQGESDGYCGNPLEPQDHIYIGALDGKMFNIEFYNERTKLTTCFVKFLPVSEGPSGTVQGGAIGTAIDETLFASSQDKAEALNVKQYSIDLYKDVEKMKNDFAVTANLNVNYRKPVPLNTTIRIETQVDDIVKSSSGSRAKSFTSFRLTSLNKDILYNEGTALVISTREAALKLAEELFQKKNKL